MTSPAPLPTFHYRSARDASGRTMCATLRGAYGLTQGALAERAGISRRSVTAVEAGERVSARVALSLHAHLVNMLPEPPSEPGSLLGSGLWVADIGEAPTPQGEVDPSEHISAP